MVGKRLINAFKWLGIVGGMVVWVGAALVFFAPQNDSDTLVIPNSFSVGQVADPAQVNANFTAISNIINGKLDDDNWDTSGPDLACSNMALTNCITTGHIIDGTIASIDIADGTIATVDIAANATTEVFTTAVPSNVAGFDCTGTWTDITGASWTVTTTSGLPMYMILTATAVKSGAGTETWDFRLMIGATGQEKVSMALTSAGNGGTRGVTVIGRGNAPGGSTTIKLQCQRPSGAGSIDISDMNLFAAQYKK